jgi:hypothetical protein
MSSMEADVSLCEGLGQLLNGIIYLSSSYNVRTIDDEKLESTLTKEHLLLEQFPLTHPLSGFFVASHRFVLFCIFLIVFKYSMKF